MKETGRTQHVPITGEKENVLKREPVKENFKDQEILGAFLFP